MYVQISLFPFYFECMSSQVAACIIHTQFATDNALHIALQGL